MRCTWASCTDPATETVTHEGETYDLCAPHVAEHYVVVGGYPGQVCRHCTTPLPEQPRRGRAREYCGKACRNAADYARRRAARGQALEAVG